MKRILFLEHAAKWNDMPGPYLIWAIAEMELANPKLCDLNGFTLTKGNYKTGNLQGLTADDGD